MGNGKGNMNLIQYVAAAQSSLTLCDPMVFPLAWRIPGTEGPCRLPSMASHRVGHDWSDLAAAAAAACQPLCPRNFPGKNPGVGCHFLLQGIFLTQGLNLCLLCWRQILYHWTTRKPNSACDTSNSYHYRTFPSTRFSFYFSQVHKWQIIKK